MGRYERGSISSMGVPRMTVSRPKECRHCGTRFYPLRPMQSVCSPICASRFVKEAKKQERQDVKVRKEAIKTIGQLEEDCRRIVQALARIRDRNDSCISCHMGPNYDGAWHGSHFRSHGGCSSLQFNLLNIHKACAQCNLFKSGNISEYRPRLVQKIGADKVDWLESQPKSKRFSREYLDRFKIVMGKRLKRAQKRIK